jgi:Domain of unknown function (DUF4283)
MPVLTPVEPPPLHRIRLSDNASFADEIRQSLILIADNELPLTDLLDGLQSHYPSSILWIARYLGNHRYLIQGPDNWRKHMVQTGSLFLRQHQFQVSTDLSCLSASTPSVKVWIKIFDLDYDMWGFHGLQVVIQPFGTLLDLDFNTRTRTDLRWARVLVELADVSLLPAVLWFEVQRSNGWRSFVKVRYEIDTPPMSGSFPQPVSVFQAQSHSTSHQNTPLLSHHLSSNHPPLPAHIPSTTFGSVAGVVPVQLGSGTVSV